jgi:hypothetical protein
MLTGFLLRSHLEKPKPRCSSGVDTRADVTFVGTMFLEILLAVGQFFQGPGRPDDPVTKPRFP